MGKMHWMSEYWIDINMKDVQYAKKLLKNPIFERSNINFGHKDGKNYIIKEVEVKGYSVKDVMNKEGTGSIDKGAVFFWIDKGLILLGKSYYPHLRFSVPKSQIVKHETDEIDVVQEIVITEWAYNNCYMLPVNKLYEDWGRHMKALISRYNTKAWDEAPMFFGSAYNDIIQELHKEEIRNAIKDYKKREKVFVENGNGDKPAVVHKKRSEEPFREEAEYIFYTDGSGNWASNKKHKAKGHFSVYLKNTQERWKQQQNKLTGNQAELLGVMSAISIADKRSYKKVKILTDSMNVVNWVTKKKDSDDYFWNAKHPNIVSLVERLRVMTKMIPNLEIKHISRNVNFAHAI